MLKSAALVSGALLAVCAVLGARLSLAARAELQQASALERRGDERGAVDHLRRAMAHYFPANPWVRRAGQRLVVLATRAEQRGEPATALRAWRALRSAVLALRAVNRPYAELRARAEEHIARLAADAPRAAAGMRGGRGRARLRRQLRRPLEPDPGWTAVALAGWAIWTGGGIGMLLAGLRRDLSLRRRRFAALALVVAIGFALFGLGLVHA